MCCLGLICAGLCLLVTLRAGAALRSVHAMVTPTAQRSGASTPERDESTLDGFLGELSIPKISLTVPILPDYDTGSLLKGIGHVKGTALPGGLGNMGLAGHRDTYFRPLRNISAGMDIRVKDANGTYHYIVDRMEVVMPDQVSVLDIGQRPELTLITCYPFNYVGAAPKRFIVHAHLLSVDADSSGRQ